MKPNINEARKRIDHFRKTGESMPDPDNCTGAGAGDLGQLLDQFMQSVDFENEEADLDNIELDFGAARKGTLDLSDLGLTDMALLSLLPDLMGLETVKKLYLGSGGSNSLSMISQIDMGAERPERNLFNSIPDGLIEAFPNLEQLDLGYNNLTSLPDTIGNLPGLERLGIAHNRLEQLPDSISQLTQLKLLRLDNNNLTALPETMTAMDSLEIVYLDGNTVQAIPENIRKRMP